MDRLTEWMNDELNGVWVEDHDYVGASHRLAEYEDTGLTPEEIKSALSALKVILNAHGKWKRVEDDCTYWFACSECGCKIPKNEWGDDWYANYCPDCGARMEGE